MTQSTQPMAQTVLEIINAGGWQLTRHMFDEAMTDEYNASHAWSVQRTEAPFCDAQATRYWSGATAYGALLAAHQALGMPLPKSAEAISSSDAFEAWLDSPVDWDMRGTPIPRRSTLSQEQQTLARYGWEAAMKAKLQSNINA